MNRSRFKPAALAVALLMASPTPADEIRVSGQGWIVGRTEHSLDELALGAEMAAEESASLLLRQALSSVPRELTADAWAILYRALPVRATVTESAIVPCDGEGAEICGKASVDISATTSNVDAVMKDLLRALHRQPTFEQIRAAMLTQRQALRATGWPEFSASLNALSRASVALLQAHGATHQLTQRRPPSPSAANRVALSSPAVSSRVQAAALDLHQLAGSLVVTHTDSTLRPGRLADLYVQHLYATMDMDAAELALRTLLLGGTGTEAQGDLCDPFWRDGVAGEPRNVTRYWLPPDHASVWVWYVAQQSFTASSHLLTPQSGSAYRFGLCAKSGALSAGAIMPHVDGDGVACGSLGAADCEIYAAAQALSGAQVAITLETDGASADCPVFRFEPFADAWRANHLFDERSEMPMRADIAQPPVIYGQRAAHCSVLREYPTGTAPTEAPAFRYRVAATLAGRQ